MKLALEAATKRAWNFRASSTRELSGLLASYLSLQKHSMDRFNEEHAFKEEEEKKIYIQLLGIESRGALLIKGNEA